jgi:hypothetical protein
MKITRLLLGSVTLAVFVVAVAVKLTGYNILGAGPVPASQISLTRQAFWVGSLYYLLTLAGIVLGVVFDSLGSVEDNAKVTLTDIRKSLSTARSWRGLVASPLVFLTVYVGVRSAPVTTPFVLLAFQNGFFWKMAMSRIANAQH